jgi:hypothetical protein
MSSFQPAVGGDFNLPGRRCSAEASFRSLGAPVAPGAPRRATNSRPGPTWRVGVGQK